MVELLDSIFSEEALDQDWAPATEGQISAALANVADVRPLAVQCKATICRVEVAASSAQAQHELGFRIATVPPFDSQIFFDYGDSDAGTEFRTKMYVARKGFKLPPSPSPNFAQ